MWTVVLLAVLAPFCQVRHTSGQLLFFDLVLPWLCFAGDSEVLLAVAEFYGGVRAQSRRAAHHRRDRLQWTELHEARHWPSCAQWLHQVQNRRPRSPKN